MCIINWKWKCYHKYEGKKHLTKQFKIILFEWRKNLNELISPRKRNLNDPAKKILIRTVVGRVQIEGLKFGARNLTVF